nr:MAG TPA: hypothetical protein [Caudoviricetes sp.]
MVPTSIHTGRDLFYLVTRGEPLGMQKRALAESDIFHAKGRKNPRNTPKKRYTIDV